MPYFNPLMSAIDELQGMLPMPFSRRQMPTIPAQADPLSLPPQPPMAVAATQSPSLPFATPFSRVANVLGGLPQEAMPSQPPATPAQAVVTPFSQVAAALDAANARQPRRMYSTPDESGEVADFPGPFMNAPPGLQTQAPAIASPSQGVIADDGPRIGEAYASQAASPSEAMTVINGSRWQQGNQSGGSGLANTLANAPDAVKSALRGYMASNPDQAFKDSPVSLDAIKAQVSPAFGIFGAGTPEQNALALQIYSQFHRDPEEMAIKKLMADAALMTAQGALATGRAHEAAVGVGDEKKIESEFLQDKRILMSQVGGAYSEQDATAKAAANLLKAHPESSFAKKLFGGKMPAEPLDVNARDNLTKAFGNLTVPEIMNAIENSRDVLSQYPGGLAGVTSQLKQQGKIPLEKEQELEREMILARNKANAPMAGKGLLKTTQTPRGYEIVYPSGARSGHSVGAIAKPVFTLNPLSLMNPYESGIPNWMRTAKTDQDLIRQADALETFLSTLK